VTSSRRASGPSGALTRSARLLLRRAWYRRGGERDATAALQALAIELLVAACLRVGDNLAYRLATTRLRATYESMPLLFTYLLAGGASGDFRRDRGLHRPRRYDAARPRRPRGAAPRALIFRTAANAVITGRPMQHTRTAHERVPDDRSAIPSPSPRLRLGGHTAIRRRGLTAADSPRTSGEALPVFVRRGQPARISLVALAVARAVRLRLGDWSAWDLVPLVCPSAYWAST